MLRYLLGALILAALLAPGIVRAKIPDDKIKVGVLQDLPEPFAGQAGNGGIVAAQMAAGDFETKYLHGDAEILAHVSTGGMRDDLDKVRDWLDKEHVAAIVSSAPAAINRRIAQMVARHHATLLVAATDADTGGTRCSPNVVVWGAGPTARARALVHVLLPLGGKQWYLAADENSTGLGALAALQQMVSGAGGSVVGTITQPIGGADLDKVAAKISQANPQVLALTESEGDLVSALRSAHLVGLNTQMTIAAPYATTAEVDDAGPPVAEGVVLVAPFYWDASDRTRRFALQWSRRMNAKPVTENAAEVYAATYSFLNAAKQADDIGSDKVLAKLRRAPLQHTLFGTVTIRQDGRAMYDMGVYRVKRPSQVQDRWAYFTRIADIPAAQVFPPGACGGK